MRDAFRSEWEGETQHDGGSFTNYPCWLPIRTRAAAAVFQRIAFVFLDGASVFGHDALALAEDRFCFDDRIVGTTSLTAL